ncbi:MAG: general stress protein [Nostoc sp.]|uniref:general stress protein n=1 Tax=Nostoc sp. TaxID=1180 RepID=UPI002FFBAC93
MTLEKERRTIGVFARCLDAQLALEELKAANFPMHKVSLIARDAEEQNDIASVEVKDSTGNISSKDTAGEITGLLVGLVLWVIPDIGRVILAGAEAIAIATTLAGGAINVTAGDLHSVLLALGIPKEQAQGYSDLVCKGYYLVIVTGIDIEIRLAKSIFNRCNIQQWVIYEPYSTPNSRYKNAVGVFSTRQDTQRALTELKTAGFAMSQVSVIAKDTNSLSGITEVDISSSKDNYTNLGIPDDIARYYQHQVTLGNYLLVLNSTDIYIAGARAILESHKIQHFGIYSQSELDAARSDRQIITNS